MLPAAAPPKSSTTASRRPSLDEERFSSHPLQACSVRCRRGCNGRWAHPRGGRWRSGNRSTRSSLVFLKKSLKDSLSLTGSQPRAVQQPAKAVSPRCLRVFKAGPCPARHRVSPATDHLPKFHHRLAHDPGEGGAAVGRWGQPRADLGGRKLRPRSDRSRLRADRRTTLLDRLVIGGDSLNPRGSNGDPLDFFANDGLHAGSISMDCLPTASLEQLTLPIMQAYSPSATRKS